MKGIVKRENPNFRELQAVEEDWSFLSHVPSENQTEAVIRAAMDQKYEAYGLIDWGIREKREDLALEAVSGDWSLLTYVPKKVQTDAVIDAAMEQSSNAYICIDENIRAKREDLALKVVKNDWTNLELVPGKIQTSKVIDAAMKQSPKAYIYIDSNIRAKREDLALKAVMSDWILLIHVPPEVQTDQVITAAMKQSSEAYFLRDWNKKTDLALKMVDSNWRLLARIPPERQTPEVIRAAMNQSPSAYQFVDIERRRTNKDLALKAVSADWELLEHVPPEAQTKAVIRAAVNQSPLAYKYLEDPLRIVSKKSRHTFAKKKIQYTVKKKQTPTSSKNKDDLVSRWDQLYHSTSQRVEGKETDDMGLFLNEEVIQKQKSHFQSLPVRDKLLLASYKCVGDKLVNNFLRRNNIGLKALYKKRTESSSCKINPLLILHESMAPFFDFLDEKGISDLKEIISATDRVAINHQELMTDIKFEEYYRRTEEYSHELLRVLNLFPPLKSSLIVYRGIKWKRYLKGRFSEIEFVNLESASVDRKIARLFVGNGSCCLWTILLPVSSRAIFVDEILNETSQYSGEKEVIILPQKYHVVESDYSDGNVHAVVIN